MLISPAQFASKILAFYEQHGRKDLPWQKNPTAYRVWVSEIMLQQTQVKTVIPYYQKFMKRFPSLKSLATSNIDEVLHHWQGLGYYSRARNLHKSAQMVSNEFKGRFPDNLEQMQSLPGIGRSTAGAVLSLAKKKPTPILDGNVKRVLARVFLVDGWYGQSAVARQLWELTEKYTPATDTAQFNQAMMDLGASFCRRSKPQCQQCPLQTDCLANLQNKTMEYPHKKPAKTIPTRQTTLLLNLNDKGAIQLQKNPPSGIWGGLWTLPSLEGQIQAKDLTSNQLAQSELVDEFRHTFTHFHLEIKVIIPLPDTKNKQNLLFQSKVEENQQIEWHNISQLEKLAFPTPVRKFLFRYFQID